MAELATRVTPEVACSISAGFTREEHIFLDLSGDDIRYNEDREAYDLTPYQARHIRDVLAAALDTAVD